MAGHKKEEKYEKVTLFIGPSAVIEYCTCCIIRAPERAKPATISTLTTGQVKLKDAQSYRGDRDNQSLYITAGGLERQNSLQSESREEGNRILDFITELLKLERERIKR